MAYHTNHSAYNKLVERLNRYPYGAPPSEFADFTKILLKLGVSIIGGCCGTTPDHIKAIRQTVDTHK